MRVDHTKQILSITLAAALAASSASAQATRRGATAVRPTAARFIVHVVFDEEYKSVTDKPNRIDASRAHDTGHAESRLHLELQASRWIKVQPGDGGSTEMLALGGGEPSSAGGAVTFSAADESRSDNGTGDKNRVESRSSTTANFSGKIAASDVTRDESPVALSVPDFSDDGGGLEFSLKVKSRMAGACHTESSGEGGTHASDDCRDIGIVGLPSTAENQDAGKTNATGYVADLEEDFDFHPEPPTQQGAESVAQLPEVPGVWYGAQTRGDRQSGYKITLAKTKTLKHKTEDGVTEDWTQKLTLDAEIVPGSPAASLDPGGKRDGTPRPAHPEAFDAAHAPSSRPFPALPLTHPPALTVRGLVSPLQPSATDG